ncbi:hypothetical protein BGP77_12605 [Saccharospirillum sp. MSK14-1]|uniref:hypothetical protein n=1 Tax=Saccharospirillum sp. MSK14-1 TaxID=1897632 RepID=UPI000D382FF5|nr:hypothetical protein [Saccharospirillum sp. MSK14-1]PTY38363.1 hypothetical protein BGP77_12605 [Saccharospirillum sp. MSK14-1]
MLTIADLRKSLNPNLDAKRKSRFEVAFRSLVYQDDYCRYHYEQFHKQHQLHLDAMGGKLVDDEILNPQYFRIAFEANCFAFFRSLHALIESVPYLLNLLIEVNKDSESRFITWKTFENGPLSKKYNNGVSEIRVLLTSNSYKELEHIANVSKHRRIVRIDSGMFSPKQNPRFCEDDFDMQFRSYEIHDLMETIYDDLHPQIINTIKSFLH